MSKTAKSPQEVSEKTKQHKLMDYHLRGEMQKANANSGSAPMAAIDGEEKQKSQSSKVDEILSIVSSTQKTFSSRFDEVVESIDSLRKEINDSIQRITESEACIADAECEMNLCEQKCIR